MKTNIIHQPSIESNDFPRDARLASYALILLERGQLDRFVLQIIWNLLPEGVPLEIVEQLEKTPTGDSFSEQINEGDEEFSARALSLFLGAPSSTKSQHFIRLVTPCLKSLIGPDRHSYRVRTEQISTKLNLNEDEITLLELGCCYRLSNEFEHIIDSHDYTQKISFIAHLTAIPYSRTCALTSKKGRLYQSGLLQMQNKNLSICHETAHFIIGISGQQFAATAFKATPKAQLPITAFNLTSIQQKTLLQILQSNKPSNLLFYGKPGTGKTELAKTLVALNQNEAVCVDCGSEGDEQERKTALLVTTNSVPPTTVIIIDEVDVLLNTQHPFKKNEIDKGWINHFLDTSKHKIIWITNNIYSIEESVRRRFSYSLNFKPLNWRQREVIWDTQLRKNRIKRFFKAPDIQNLAKRFPISPGLLAYAAQTLSSCRVHDMPLNELHSMLNEILTRQLEFTEGTKSDNKLAATHTNYDLHALNTDFDPAQLIQGLGNWQESGSDFGMNLLFWGWPGTGKTEFAKHLAEQLNKELLVKRMSDLQSKWVGETEKQIAAAFRDAAENDAILFLDEADSLFINRQTANRSWETSQTNEILTQMENFSGILICCTNLLEHLDEAAIRRFAFKIKFLPLADDGKLRLYRKYFSTVPAQLTAAQENGLSKVRNLCPGDIKAVWQRTRFLGEQLPHASIIAELEKEVSYKQGNNKSPIGF